MKIEKDLKFKHIFDLEEEERKEIEEELKKLNLSKEDLNNALNSKICDLEDTIKLEYVALDIQKEKRRIEKAFEFGFETDVYNESGYIDDFLIELASENVDIYNDDLIAFASRHYDYIEESVSEFGTDVESFDFWQLIRNGESLYNEEKIYEEKENIILYYALCTIQQLFDIQYLNDEQFKEFGEIDFLDFNRFEEIDEELNMIFDVEEEKKND